MCSSDLGQILTGGITYMSDQFNNLTGKQKHNYQYLLNAAYSFQGSAKAAVQTARNFYNAGNNVAAKRWLKYALTEATKQYQTETAADTLATNGLGSAYNFVNGIYETSKIAFSTACDALGGPTSPASLACGAFGDQMFIATDAMIASTNGGLTAAENQAATEEIVNGLIALVPMSSTVSGSATFGQTLQQMASNPKADQVVKNALIQHGGTAIAGGVATQIINNLRTGSLRQFSYSNSMANNHQPKAVPNSGNATLNGQTVDTQGDQLVSTGTVSGYGTLKTGGFQNLGTIDLHGDNSYIFGFVNNIGKLNITNSKANFFGNVTNTGDVKAANSTVKYAGPFANDGAYTSDPSKNYFHDLVVGPGGYLVAGKNNLFSVAGDFLNQSTENKLWQTGLATLAFTGSGAHEFDLAGQDLGPAMLGYQNNFAWGTLDLTGLFGELTLGPGNPDFTDALYIRDLLGAKFVNNMATDIFGNGLNVYYLAFDPQNVYLGGLRYGLPGGGSLIPITQISHTVPAPGTLWLLLIALPPLAWALRRRPQH